MKFILNNDDLYELNASNTEKNSESLELHKEDANVVFGSVIMAVYLGVIAIGAHNIMLDNYPKYENILGYIFGRIRVKKNNIVIKGIVFDNFMDRIRRMFHERSLSKAFDRKYTFFEELFWKIKIIKKRNTVVMLSVPEFFALELINLFKMLEEHYGMSYYGAMAHQVYNKTWVSEKYKLSENTSELNTSILKSQLNSKFKLKPHQLEFIQKYPVLKARGGLRGQLLSFDQGLGKTLTSIALSIVLDKQKIVIVCPNSLRENWENEISQYLIRYTKNPDLAKTEIYVHKKSQPKNHPHAKFLIYNQEATADMISQIPDNEVDMVIIDESQNFRNISGIRSESLFKLLDKTTRDCDYLPMSGTPIKATPSELSPMLLLLDPRFDMQAAVLFNKIFKVDSESTAPLVQTRISSTIYRRTKKQVLQLSEKYRNRITLGVENYQKYRLENIQEQVQNKFELLWAEVSEERKERMVRYVYMVRKYSSANSSETEKYVRYVLSGQMDDAKTVKRKNIHELTLKYFKEFTDKNVIGNVPDSEKKEFKRIETDFLQMRKSTMSRALGSVYPPMRAEMYSQMFLQNQDYIVDLVKKNIKKTLVFSTMVDVVKTIHNGLKPQVGSEMVIGGNSQERFNIINRFKYNDEINVLCATSQTLSTGVTLTEANQVLFFGVPWRNSDLEQASDRVHRIGQTHDVNINIFALDDTKPNLSSRMDDIVKWSEGMFDSMINDNTI